MKQATELESSSICKNQFWRGICCHGQCPLDIGHITSTIAVRIDRIELNSMSLLLSKRPRTLSSRQPMNGSVERFIRSSLLDFQSLTD